MLKNNIIDGKKIAKQKLLKLKVQVKLLKKEHQLVPVLAIIQIGNNIASSVYIKNKINTAKSIGIKASKILLPVTIENEEIISVIEKLNNDKLISGIIVQLPLPSHIKKDKILSTISPEKDVDGFNPINMGYLYAGLNYGFVPCTALGVIELIKQHINDLSGLKVAIVGRSEIVGKPLIHLLLKENCTVTICHSKTKNLSKITYSSDVVIAATGKVGLLSYKDFKPNTVVIDVGINRIENSKNLVGDVDFKSVQKKVKFITPVPDGVGPMTVLYLLSNTFNACCIQNFITTNN